MVLNIAKSPGTNNGTPVQSQSERDKTVAGNEDGSELTTEGLKSRGAEKTTLPFRFSFKLKMHKINLKC